MQPEPARVAETRAWFTKAARDLRAAEVLLAANPPLLGEVVFHCQQTAEKAMKGFLTWNDRPFGKTHDLAVVGSHCVAQDQSLEPVCRRAERLSVFAWVFRYPGDPEEPAGEEAQSALVLAREVLEAMLSRLPSELRP
jgi:HEPN domain-containing protein